MRIISGSFRGRRLQGPGKQSQIIRPTAERAREALFNILGPNLSGVRVLDLFAGTGALALEALSRGAELAVAVDNGSSALALLQTNRALCGCLDSCYIKKRSLAGKLDFLVDLGQDYGPFGLVFLDPPYGRGLSLPVLTFLANHRQLLTPEVIILVEDETGASLPSQIVSLKLADERHYGATGLWFYRFLDISASS